MDELNPSNEELSSWGLRETVEKERIKDDLLKDQEDSQKPEQEIISLFASMHDINTQESFDAYRKKFGLGNEELLVVARRSARWVELCEKRFKNKAATLFLQKKSSLDKVSYSLLFFEDEALAGEIFVRIKEAECSLDDALKQSSQGPPGLSTGRVGPVALGEMPSALAELMRVSQPGQLWPPKQIEGGWVIVRHEKLWPAVFNRYERLRLLLELGDMWITDQRKKA